MKAAPKFKEGDEVVYIKELILHSDDVLPLFSSFKVTTIEDTVADPEMGCEYYIGTDLEDNEVYGNLELEFLEIFNSPLYQALK